MTSYSFGDVILVPFPFTNQSATKKRPAVIISSQLYHQHRPDVILMAITSQLYGMPGGILVNDWQNAGLLKPSAIKPIITTIEANLILQKLGQLQAIDQKALHNLLSQILG